MANKQKFSDNREKAKAEVARIHTDIANANARLDYLNKASHTLSKNHAVVCTEGFQVKNMYSSTKGDTAQPGKNVRENSCLNKSILDQGWSIFATQIDYKLAWR